MAKPEINEFFDINKLSRDWGLIVFPISMARIENAQKPDKCIDYINIFNGNPKNNFKGTKISTPKIGVNHIYGDLLYVPLQNNKLVIRDKFLPQIVKHKNRFKKLIKKEGSGMQIHSAFAFQTWSDVWINFDGDFGVELKKLRKLFEKDTVFQKFVKQDCKQYKKRMTEKQIMFFLEEHLMFYLLVYGKLLLPNQYVDHRENWILMAYPGKPPKGLVYLCQLNPLNLKHDNPYIGQYDLQQKKFYDFNRLDLETWDYE